MIITDGATALWSSQSAFILKEALIIPFCVMASGTFLGLLGIIKRKRSISRAELDSGCVRLLPLVVASCLSFKWCLLFLTSKQKMFHAAVLQTSALYKHRILWLKAPARFPRSTRLYFTAVGRLVLLVCGFVTALKFILFLIYLLLIELQALCYGPAFYSVWEKHGADPTHWEQGKNRSVLSRTASSSTDTMADTTHG